MQVIANDIADPCTVTSATCGSPLVRTMYWSPDDVVSA